MSKSCTPRKKRKLFSCNVKSSYYITEHYSAIPYLCDLGGIEGNRIMPSWLGTAASCSPTVVFHPPSFYWSEDWKLIESHYLGLHNQCYFTGLGMKNQNHVIKDCCTSRNFIHSCIYLYIFTLYIYKYIKVCIIYYIGYIKIKCIKYFYIQCISILYTMFFGSGFVWGVFFVFRDFLHLYVYTRTYVPICT